MRLRIANLGAHWDLPIMAAVFLGLYLLSLYSYLLFHSLAEIFSIVVGCGLFLVAWNVREFIRNNYLLFIGVAYLFVAGIDLMHMLSYKGMGVFPGSDANLATQLWIAARYMESVSLLVAPLFIARKPRVNVLFAVFSAAFTLLLVSIFYWGIFPVCYVEGVGLTTFKIVSEYVICLILLAALALLAVHRTEFEARVLRLVLASIIFSIGSELAFTLYISVFGLANLIGHYFKIISFYLMYRAIIETGLREPYGLLFRELEGEKAALRKSEEALRKAHDGLEFRVQERTAELETAKQAMATERQKLYGILETMPALVSLLTSDHQVVFANRSFREKFGEDKGGRCFEYCFGRKEPCEFCETYKALETGEPHQWEFAGPDGSIIDMHNFPFIDTDGSFLVLEMGIDITKRKRAEHELKQTLADLIKSNADLEQFAYVASHDLQEPLRTVAGAVQMLEKNNRGKLDAHSEQLIHYAVDYAHRMKVLITDLLTYSRLSTRGRPFETVDVQEVLDRSIGNLDSLAAEKGAEITYGPMPTIKADATQLTQVFQNLIGNAVKFGSDRAPKVRVSAKRDSTEWIFSVEDNGIGIDRAHFDRIFVIFQQLSKKGPFHGTGMGLAIVKKIVERHRGRVWLESKVGAGSTFYFTIPEG